MLHVICILLRLGHLSVRVGDSSRRCEEIVKKSRIAPLNAIITIIINWVLLMYIHIGGQTLISAVNGHLCKVNICAETDTLVQ